MKNKLNFWHMLLGVISIILIFLYFSPSSNDIVSNSYHMNFFTSCHNGQIFGRRIKNDCPSIIKSYIF